LVLCDLGFQITGQTVNIWQADLGPIELIDS